jgi:hypothetical protein
MWNWEVVMADDLGMWKFCVLKKNRENIIYDGWHLCLALGV